MQTAARAAALRLQLQLPLSSGSATASSWPAFGSEPQLVELSGMELRVCELQLPLTAAGDRARLGEWPRRSQPAE